MQSSRLLASLAAILVSLVATAVAPAQGSPSSVQLAPPPVLAAFDVSAATLQRCVVPDPLATGVSNPFRISLELGPRRYDFYLEPVDVRGPGYMAWLETPTGAVPMPAGPITTYRGCSTTDTNVCIAASVYGGVIRAVIRIGDELWSVQPLSDGLPTSPSRVHVVCSGAASHRPGVRCGNQVLSTPATPGGFIDSVYVCELALEADHALYLANNSNGAATQAEVLGIVNAVDLIYQTDLSVSFEVTQLIVHAFFDPYSSSDAYVLLDEMRTRWNTAASSVPRDAAHLFTDRPVGAATNGAVGLAYTGTVCNVQDAYGLSQTRWTPNMSLRVALTAHELGHNFGSDHCDLTSGCSIMCSDIGGCSGATASFGATALAEMNQYLQNVGCLTLVPTAPTVTGATPALIPTIDPPLVTVHGSGFLGATEVRVGGASVPNFQVLADTMLVFEPPEALTINSFYSLTVGNAAGVSNGTVLFYQACSPARVSVADAVLIGQPLTWHMGGQPNDIGVLAVSFFGTTSPLGAFDLLDNSLALWAGPFDSNGIASFTVPFIPLLLPTYSFYSQVLEQNGSGTLVSTSKVKLTHAQ